MRYTVISYIYRFLSFKIYRILHTSGFSETEFQIQKSVIHGNVVSAMVNIINAMTQFNTHFEDIETEVKCYCI